MKNVTAICNDMEKIIERMTPAVTTMAEISENWDADRAEELAALSNTATDGLDDLKEMTDTVADDRIYALLDALESELLLTGCENPERHALAALSMLRVVIEDVKEKQFVLDHASA